MDLQNRSLLSADEAEVLCQFENYPSLELLSEKLNRDLTVLSKILKRVSEKTDALIKVGGRWKLTDSGKYLNQATRDYIFSQNSIINGRSLLRIGSNREFATRIIAPNIRQFQEYFQDREIALAVFESGSEMALLDGRIDLGFDCGRPTSPDVLYKRLIKEEVIAVATPNFCRQFRDSFRKQDFSQVPHLLYERMPPDKYLGQEGRQVNIVLRSNDIAAIRSICSQGVGWALLPKYAVQEELKVGILRSCFPELFESESYGVWRLRSRKHLTGDFANACKWLEGIKLN